MENKKNIIISWLVNFNLDKSSEYIAIGNFRICSHGYAYGHFPNNINKEKNDFNEYFLIYETNEIITKSFENETFVDIMENLFKVLFYYMGVRVTSRPKYAPFSQEDKSITVYSTGMEISVSCKSSLTDTENDYFEITQGIYHKTGNNKQISSYIDKKPETEIERKINLAVNWIGNSLDNRNLIEGYTELCIALETLLSGESSPLERGTAYQIREFGAFLCAETPKERMITNEKIKKLYAIRCAITHTGVSSKLNEETFYELLEILKKIIHKLFILLETKKIDTYAKLVYYIDTVKFS